MPPLSGIRILDLSRLLPGPYATLLLADLGAEVIKVETPRVGDYARHAPPEFGGNDMFYLLNRGKKSVGLNYRNKRGREIFLELATSADVIIETFKPGSVDKWKIGYEAVKAINPGVVYCSLSGYGQDGPYRLRAGHDLNYVALAGMLGLNAAGGQPPVVPGVQVADLGGAMMATIAILGALMGRERTGEGQYLDIAMLDTVVSLMMPVAGGWWHGTGQAPAAGKTPLGGGLPCYGVYETRDGQYLTFGAIEPPFWSTFCEKTGRPDLLKSAFVQADIPKVIELFKTQTAAEWLEMFEGQDVCLEPINSLTQAFNDPQIRHRGLTGGEVQPQRGKHFVGSPFPYPANDAPAPTLGANSMEILGAAGIDQDELEYLLEKKVIAAGG
jgi:crotonobetainyl-CoA:carnitine CoA-transferase CaiB-like acyl-CoA transferase